MNYQDAWRGQAHCTVFDADYDEGSSAQVLIDVWRADPQRSPRLHVIALSADLKPHCLMPGFHRIPQAEPGLTLDLLSAPIEAALGQLSARVDLFRLRGLEAAGTDFVRALGRVAAPQARLLARGLTHEQTAALEAEGFVFEACPEPDSAVGRAVVRFEARFASRKPRPPAPPVPERRAIVLGAGIAGAAACERLCARGWEVTLVERHERPAMEASGNLAGIFMPLVSRDDNIPTRLTRAAYLFALRHWERLGGIGRAIEGQACGVLQLARDAGHAEVQRAIAASGAMPPEFAEWLERPQAEALLGLPAPDGGWLFRQGGWARPGSVVEAMLAACGGRLQRRFCAGSVRIGYEDGQWLVTDEHGVLVARSSNLILANGAGAMQIPQAAPLPLTAMRGQVSHVPADMLPPLPMVLCREAYVTPPSHGVASAGATYDLDDPEPALSPASHAQNLERLRGLLSDPQAARGAPLQGRVGFRCIAPDRLPLVGRLPDFAAAGSTERLRDVPRHPGLYGLLGYASRGLIWAGWAAELLAAQLEGEPLPLESSLVDALDPARFVLRARRTSRGPQPE
jgi:tRNA 5-methylaminomethyl-2-thiouridine biosynthesis bifunctional protein